MEHVSIHCSLVLSLLHVSDRPSIGPTSLPATKRWLSVKSLSFQSVMLSFLFTDESEFELRPWRAVQPIQIFDKRLGNFVLPGKRYHYLVGMLQEFSKILVAQIPCGAARILSVLLLLERVDFARAPCSLLPKCIVSFVSKSKNISRSR